MKMRVLAGALAIGIVMIWGNAGRAAPPIVGVSHHMGPMYADCGCEPACGVPSCCDPCCHPCGLHLVRRTLRGVHFLLSSIFCCGHCYDPCCGGCGDCGGCGHEVYGGGCADCAGGGEMGEMVVPEGIPVPDPAVSMRTRRSYEHWNMAPRTARTRATSPYVRSRSSGAVPRATRASTQTTSKPSAVKKESKSASRSPVRTASSSKAVAEPRAERQEKAPAQRDAAVQRTNYESSGSGAVPRNPLRAK